MAPAVEGRFALESFEAILPYLERFSYPGLFGLLLACSFGFPFSKTLSILAAGVLASQGVGNLYVFMAISMAGLVTADGTFYLLGYLGGERVLKWRGFSRRQFRERLLLAEKEYRRQGWWAVFSARFTPFLRTVIFFVAGMSRMSPQRFFLADVLSALLYAPALLLAGYLFSENRQLLLLRIRESEEALAILFFVLLLLLLFRVLRRRKGRGNKNP